jgi:hypothetical protein
MPARAPIGVADDLAEIRHILKRIYDLARDRRTFCRQSIPAELPSIAAQANLVAQAVEDPESLTFSDAEAEDLSGA